MQRRSAANVFVISAVKIGIGRAKRRHTLLPRRGRTVLRLFGITKAGLLAMTISVFTLWGCIALETTTLRRAAMDARASFRTLERLRQQSVPASEPRAPFHSQSVRSS